MLTGCPGRSSPRRVRSRVSGERSAANALPDGLSAVRQAPLTAMLSPWLGSRSSGHFTSISRRAPAAERTSRRTVPTVSIRPVNIHILRSHTVELEVVAVVAYILVVKAVCHLEVSDSEAAHCGFPII